MVSKTNQKMLVFKIEIRTGRIYLFTYQCNQSLIHKFCVVKQLFVVNVYIYKCVLLVLFAEHYL